MFIILGIKFEYFLFSSNIFLELCCFICALFLIKKEVQWRLFIPYLLIVLTVESMAVLLYLSNQKNSIIYFYYIPLMHIFNVYQLYKISKIKRKQLYLICLMSIVTLTVFGIETVANGTEGLPPYFFTLNNIYISGFCFYYLKKTLQSDIYENLLTKPEFWIVIGLLIHGFGSIVCFMFLEPLNHLYRETGLPLRQYIILFLNFFLYSSWSYAFICKYRQNISS